MHRIRGTSKYAIRAPIWLATMGRWRGPQGVRQQMVDMKVMVELRCERDLRHGEHDKREPIDRFRLVRKPAPIPTNRTIHPLPLCWLAIDSDHWFWDEGDILRRAVEQQLHGAIYGYA